jgi:tetratricopeptide (TPR) repeat protein
VAPDLQRTRLFEAVVALLGWAAREAAVLLVLEDLHDADEPSLELAAYVARRLSELPVMMVFTRREVPASPAADRVEHALRARGLLACEMRLTQLAPDAVARLARQAAGLDEADVEVVVERAEGNALLAVETARALAAGEKEVASNLRGSVRAALAGTSRQARGLVEAVAVAARPLEPHEIDRLAAAEVAADALETGLLVSTGSRVGFHHALIREAAYAEIPEPRRRAAHGDWARTLLACEQDGAPRRPDEVARHLRMAGADRDAVPQLVRAAADARAVAALDQAVAYLEEALTIAPDRGHEWLELVELEGWRGRREQAEAAFDRAIGLFETDDPLTRARAWLRRARTYHGSICLPRSVLECTGHALEQLELVPERAPAEQSEALAAQAWAEAVAGSVDEAERLLAELSTAAPVTDDLRTYDVGHARGIALMRRGRFTDAYGPSIAAGEAIGRAGRPDLAYGCWAQAAGAACAAGDPDRALEFLDRAMAAVTGKGLQSVEVHLLAERSFVLRRLGRLEEARAAAESEEALAEQLDHSGLKAMALHDRGLVALAAGDHVLAADLLAAALVDGAPISRPLTRLALAEALARAGRPEEAADQVRATVLEPLRPSDFPETLVPRLARVLGLIAVARGERAEAERRLREATAGWERLLERTIRAESLTTVLADLGRPVVGLIEPERELARARADLVAVLEGVPDAVVS